MDDDDGCALLAGCGTDEQEHKRKDVGGEKDNGDDQENRSEVINNGKDKHNKASNNKHVKVCNDKFISNQADGNENGQDDFQREDSGRQSGSEGECRSAAEHSLSLQLVGNSFSIDTSAALPSILSSLGINNVNVYVLYKGGCSMKQHYEFFKSGENVYELYRYNSQGEQQLERAISIGDAMQRFPYDVVVWQQYSLDSGDYSTYEPYLSKLIQAYNITKSSPRTTFAFNETWAYASNNKNLAKYKTQSDMWKSLCTSIRKMKAASGIDVIIPCGTAVQNARGVEALKVDNELTRDGTHISMYAGRYLLACTFFESIIAPCLNRSIREDNTVYGKSTDASQVNDTNRRLLQNCARLAVSNNYEISEFAGQ